MARFDEAMTYAALRTAESIGRPVGSKVWLADTEASNGLALAVWMQLGVIDEPAAAQADAAGLKLVMDRCPKIEIARLGRVS